MGLMRNLKDKLAPAKDKVADFAKRHEEQVHHGLDKAAKVVDERTKGKYSNKIQTGTGKAKGAVDRLAHKGDDTATDRSAPPSDSPPPDSPPPTT
ncbi:antitoxin [Streptomyces sp. NPDC006385]|uniref:antitoxin n=1 Tax=Streptomyces sp. NPDC006385 TaxID=3156761 RepID=UPI0033AB14E1